MKRFILFSVTVFATVFCSQGLWAEEREYTDTQYKVNYTYDTNGNTAKVKAGSYNTVIGSPAAKGDIVIPERIVVDGREYTVDCIGSAAFGGGVTTVQIPSTVKIIAGYAFALCYDLKSVNLPDNLEFIGDLAFSDDPYLTDIVIPASVTSIGLQPFFRCSGLQSITVAEGNTVYDSRNNCNAIIETATGKLISGCNNTVLPTGIKTIAWGAFDAMKGITSVNIPEGVTMLDSYAYAGCGNLEQVTFPESLEELGWECFDYCTKLTSVTLPKGLKRMGDANFISCTGLTKVIALMEEPFEIEVGNFSTWGGTFTTATLFVPVGCVGKYRNTSGWNSFAKIKEIGSEIGEKREYTDPTNKVVYTYFTDETTAMVKAGSFENGCGSPEAFGDVIIPEKITVDGKDYTVTGIGLYAFFDNQNITSVTMPNTVLSVGEEAFGLCWSLSDVVLSESLEEICSGTFNQCSLKNIVIPEGVKKIGSSAFRWCNVDNIQIPSSVTTIGGEAFRGSPLTSMRIPATVTHIGDNPFKGCPITSMVVEDGNPYYDSRNNCNAIILTAENKIISGFESTKFPADVKIIGGGAFSDSKMKKFAIPEGIEKIEGGAFFTCWSLEEISLPNTLKEISDQVFTYCSNLSTIKIPSSVTTIGYRCFSESGLVSFTFPDGFTTIESTMFEHCRYLQEIVIPASVTTIRHDAFHNCPSLQRVICKNDIPVELGTNERNFELEDGSFTDATLYVPANSIEKYRAADVWKNFKNIRPLDELVDDSFIFSLGEVTTLPDGTCNLPVVLDNSINITAFQTDIKVDDGATVEGVTLSNRAAADHNITTKKLVDGTLRVVVYSRTSQPFEGNTGTLLNIQVSVQSGMEHLVSLTNIELTGTDGAGYTLSDFSETFASFPLGDANCDGHITITDVAAIINHILGDTPTPFNVLAADVSQNGRISVTDVVQLINKYLFDSEASFSRADSRRVENELASMVTLANPTIVDDHTVSVDVMLNKEAKDITAFQFDVALPERVTLVSDGLHLSGITNHEVIARMMSNGMLRVVCYSMQNDVFADITDVVLTINFDIDRPQTDGIYTFGMANVELSNSRAEPIYSKNMSLNFIFDSETLSIHSLSSQSRDHRRIYNLNGQRKESDTVKGVYIKNGKKYLK